jgi:hypothetical protein
MHPARISLFLSCALILGAADLAPVERQILERISADSLRGHVSFLASDALEGRDTPSKGLDVAAEYISAHFRKLRLEPAGDEGYFQTAAFARISPVTAGFTMTVEAAGQTIDIPAAKVVLNAAAAANLEKLPLVKIDPTDTAAIDAMAPGSLAGKALIYVLPQTGGAQSNFRLVAQNRRKLLALKPALAITTSFMRSERPRLVDLADSQGAPPTVAVSDNEIAAKLRELPNGPVPGSVSAAIPEQKVENLKLRNVVAVLRGSDPVLRDSYVLVSAHYDHVGVAARGEGDLIRNGANDNASGTSTVMELAEALSRAPQRPRRSIVFALYFGEEYGLFGSRAYARKPPFPLAKTVANLNLEQMGRTDDNSGDTTGKITASGFDYTTLGDILTRESARAGVVAWKDDRNSDSFFARSDNQALADAGVPAVTLCAAWTYSDYHRAGDHWDKLNYDNMALLTRAVALTTLEIANASDAPKWNPAHAKTGAYVEAARKLYGQAAAAGEH